MSLLGTSYGQDTDPLAENDDETEIVVQANVSDDSDSNEESHYLRKTVTVAAEDITPDCFPKSQKGDEEQKDFRQRIISSSGFQFGQAGSPPDSKCLSSLYSLLAKTEDGYSINAELRRSAVCYNPAFLPTLEKQFSITSSDSHLKAREGVVPVDSYTSIREEQLKYEKVKREEYKRKRMARVKEGSMKPPPKLKMSSGGFTAAPRAEQLRKARVVAMALAQATNAPASTDTGAALKKRRIA